MIPHERVHNPGLYSDRTVQDWHYDTFGTDATAIDLDLFGACKRCSEPLYLIESTTNPNKPTNILHALAERAEVPAMLVRHDTMEIVRATWVWPRRRVPIGGEQDLIDAITELREAHRCR